MAAPGGGRGPARPGVPGGHPRRAGALVRQRLGADPRRDGTPGRVSRHRVRHHRAQVGGNRDAARHRAVPGGDRSAAGGGGRRPRLGHRHAGHRRTVPGAHRGQRSGGRAAQGRRAGAPARDRRREPAAPAGRQPVGRGGAGRRAAALGRRPHRSPHRPRRLPLAGHPLAARGAAAGRSAHSGRAQGAGHGARGVQRPRRQGAPAAGRSGRRLARARLGLRDTAEPARGPHPARCRRASSASSSWWTSPRRGSGSRTTAASSPTSISE